MNSIEKSNLLPCPYCGSKHKNLMGYDYHKIGCSNNGCKIYGIAFEHNQWNTRAPQSEWVSVDDRLPSENCFVIGRSVGGYGMDGRYSTGTSVLYFSKLMGKGQEFQSQVRASNVNITHWMPLPAPPKQS